MPEQLVLVNGGWGVGVLLQVLLSACLRLAVWRSYLSLPTPPPAPCHAAHRLSFGVFFVFQFFSCVVMIAYGVSAFFSFQAWRGVGSNAATSQMAGGYA